MEIFWLYLGQIVAYLGGAGFIILALSGWIGKILANKFMKAQEAIYQKDIEKYKNELSIQLTKYKAANERINYISKAQFDKEFEICQKAHSLMCDLAYSMGKDAATKIGFEITEAVHKKLVKYMNYVKQNAPFIDEELYNSFSTFASVCSEAIRLYDQEAFKRRDDEVPTKKDVENVDAYMENAISLYHQIDNFSKKMRNYLHSLRVYD